jgi:hypothetical protein
MTIGHWLVRVALPLVPVDAARVAAAITSYRGDTIQVIDEEASFSMMRLRVIGLGTWLSFGPSSPLFTELRREQRRQEG